MLYYKSESSLFSEHEDDSLLSLTEIYPIDTYQRTNNNQEKLLSLLLDQNFPDFKNLFEGRSFDINYFYGAPHNGTLLDIACRTKGMVEFVKVILSKRRKNVKAINKITGKAAIHEAIENSEIDVVEVLIINSYLFCISDRQDYCSVEDRDGNTPLHSAIKVNDLQIIKCLLEICKNYGCADTIDIINISNLQNPTPLHIALREGYTEAANLLLQYPFVDLDFQTDSESRTCRQIIQQKYPELNEKLLTGQTRYTVNNYKILSSLLKRGETEIFINLVSKMKTEYGNHVRKLHSYLLKACDAGYTDVVDILLKQGVNPNHGVDNTMIPILIAAEAGYYGIFIKLLKHPKIKLCTWRRNRSPLHAVIKGMIRHREDKAERQHYKCLEVLLNEVIPQRRLNINYQNSIGDTALHYAVLSNDECVIKSLIYAGAHLYPKNDAGKVPLTSIKANILEDYLDNCISLENHFKSVEFLEIIFDYTQFVQPNEFYKPEGQETKFFTIIERVPELRKLLKHPVSKSFLHVKWYFVRKYYYINFIFYLILCFMLSWYIFGIHQGTWSSTIYNSSTLSTSSSNEDHIVHSDFKSIIMIFYGMLVIREAFQFLVSPRIYIKSLENWLEMFVISLIGTFLVIVNKTNAHEQSSISACVIIVSWIELLFLLGKLPTFSIYIEIFKMVAFNFFKYLSVYMLLIISFAFSFYILFKNKVQLNTASFTNQTNMTNGCSIEFWQDPKMSFLKSIVMLTGEFSTETIPLGLTFASKHLFFILFIFLNTIVLYNLLNGLAISDIQAIREDAELVALVSLVKLISQLERMATFAPFRFLHWKFFNNTLKVTLYPEKKIHVLPYRENLTGFDSCRLRKTLEKHWFKKQFDLKMHPSIVEQAMQILENCKEVNVIDEGTTHTLQVNAVKKNRPKFQSINKLGQHFTAQIRDLKIKMDEKIARRDEKLIQIVSNLMTDFVSKIDKLESKIDKLLESRIDKN